MPLRAACGPGLKARVPDRPCDSRPHPPNMQASPSTSAQSHSWHPARSNEAQLLGWPSLCVAQASLSVLSAHYLSTSLLSSLVGGLL